MSTNAVLMAKDSAMIDYVYSSAAIEWLLANTNIHPETVTVDNLDSELPKLSQTEVIFSTWGIPRLNEQQIAAMPKLKAVFYAAGSVRAFAEPFLKREIMICSAVEANAIPVAEFCLGQILLSLKGYFINNRVAKSGQWSDAIKVVGPGVYGETVALLGVGSISRHLLKLLKNFNIRVIAVSNYLQSRPEEAALLGIERLVTMDEAFRSALVVSNHLPDKPDNRGIITKQHFAAMRPGATFINTGRGAQVDESGMVEVLRERDDLSALLDVTFPEPPSPDSPLYSLDNIQLSTHIAGSMNDEVHRMADYMLDEFRRWRDGKALHYQVYQEDFAKRA